MQFTTLTEEEYDTYWENHPLKTFLSSSKIGKLRKKSNWTVHYVGVKENNKIIAASMLLGHKKHFNKYEYYSPRGFLLDFNNKPLLDFFVKELKVFLKKKKAYIFRVDPYVIYKQRDKDGNIVPNGIDNSSIVDNLKQLGFKKVSIEDTEQVIWMFSLDLEGKDEDQIFKEMKQNTRNLIRKAERFGITVKEINYDELDRLQKILEETGERKKFKTRKLSYFQDMYSLFHDSNEVKYFVTELDLGKYIKVLEEEKQEKEGKIKKLKDTRFNEGTKKTLLSDIEYIEKRIKDTKETIEKAGKEIITLSGSMFMLIQPEVVYLLSGNYEEYLKFNSQYLIQWELIKYGIKNGFKKHNFYGIPANINEHPKDYGIYEFKRGFNGYVEELIGEYELPLSIHYYLYKLIHKIKKNK